MAFKKLTGKLNRLNHLVYEAPVFDSRDVAITGDDVEEQLGRGRGSSLFLGVYAADQIRAALEEVGIVDRLREKGYRDLVLDCSCTDRFAHRLDFFAGVNDPSRLIGQIVLRTGRFTAKPTSIPVPTDDYLHILFIEWILMQDIGRRFTAERKRLPGQEHPGLGVGRQVVRLLLRVARTLKVDGILNCPEHYHNGHFYSQYGGFKFYDPRMQAMQDALDRDLEKRNIADVSFAMQLGCVRDTETGDVVEWKAEEQIRPTAHVLEEYFASDAYRRAHESALTVLGYELDERCLAARSKKGMD